HFLHLGKPLYNGKTPCTRPVKNHKTSINKEKDGVRLQNDDSKTTDEISINTRKTVSAVPMGKIQ
ncbi:MAG: hypothetical protein ACD_63C00017G0001, partial [uncultured bacterium]